ncbi:MAG TPA: SulP family inorganic anion transporter [Acidimicrobiales bacterium]|nr:SulP family inorganic anion transporter [Acidimicrobiales bacterium]
MVDPARRGGRPSAAEPAPGSPLALTRFVLFSSLRGYQRRWAARDSLAALTLLVIAVPEQLATSRLAGMPPITGLYAFVAGTVMYAALGSSPQMSVGADSTIAPLFAVGIAGLAASGSAHYVDLVGILAVTVGFLVAAVGLLRLGWIAEFLSGPIIAGFLGGVALIIVVHQLPDLLGFAGTGGTNLHRLGYIARHLKDTKGWALGIGLGVIAVVVASERLSRRMPGALIALVGSTILVAALGLRSHGVAVLGSFAHGAPRWGLVDLSWSSLRSVFPLSAVVALVVVTQSAATTRAFADQGDYEVDVSRDFVGVGAGSVLAGVAGSFPVNASPPRTAAVATAGGRTQAAALLAAAAVVLLVPAAALLKDLPVATLAAVLMFVAARIFPFRQLADIARFDAFEMGLAIITLLTVAFAGVLQGIAVAVALAILDRTRRSARPQMHVLGRIPGTTSWAPLATEGASQVPGVLVVLFATPLWYANAVHFREQLDAALHRAVGRPGVVVLDAIGMSDIDYTGCRALGQALDELDRRHIGFAFARAGQRVRHSLARAKLEERIGADRFFPAVDEAVTALTGPATAAGG